ELTLFLSLALDHIFRLMKTLPTQQVIKIIDRISPYLEQDIISANLSSLLQATRVCKNWKLLCEEQSVWRSLFKNRGWDYDQDEMDAYLSNTMTTTSPQTKVASVSLNRTFRHKSIRLYKPTPHKQAKELSHHYNWKSSSNCINWKRLYQNRFEIERRWVNGIQEIYEFPPLSTSLSELHKAEGIYCVQFDKNKYVTGSRDNTIKVWDKEGKCMQTIEGHTASVLCLQYNDTVIVSGSSDSTLMVSDLASGNHLRSLTGHSDSVLCLKLVGNDRVISCSKDRSLKLWNMDTGECIRTYQGHEAAVNAVQWMDNHIVSASGDRTIRIWNLETGECIKTLVGHSRGVACVDYDGSKIYSGSSDNTIKIWDAKTGECDYTLVGHTHLVRTIQLDKTANRLVSGCYNGMIKMWDLNERKLICDVSSLVHGRVLNLKFDFSKIVCCTNSLRVVVFNFAFDVNTKFLL
ncbi:hypothetical protein INT47_006861, partial [Mucor saturninus]